MPRGRKTSCINMKQERLNSRAVQYVSRTVANQIEEREPMAGRPNNYPIRSELIPQLFLAAKCAMYPSRYTFKVQRGDHVTCHTSHCFQNIEESQLNKQPIRNVVPSVFLNLRFDLDFEPNIAFSLGNINSIIYMSIFLLESTYMSSFSHSL